MITESFIDTQSTVRARILATRRLASDLAEDPADLLDLSAALGTEFRNVVGAILRAPERHAADVVRALGTAKGSRTAPPSAGDAPFVWMTLIPAGARSQRTVRAGWLSPRAVDAIAAEAHALGSGTEIRIIVPLDGGENTAARVHALCLGFPLDLKVTIEVQRDRSMPGSTSTRREHGSWWRSGGGPSHAGGGRRSFVGTWIVLDPAGAAS